MGGPDRVVEVEVGHLLGAGQQRAVGRRRIRNRAATRSSWRTWPKVNERRNVPSVEGAALRRTAGPSRRGGAGSASPTDSVEVVGQQFRPRQQLVKVLHEVPGECFVIQSHARQLLRAAGGYSNEGDLSIE